MIGFYNLMVLLEISNGPVRIGYRVDNIRYIYREKAIDFWVSSEGWFYCVNYHINKRMREGRDTKDSKHLHVRMDWSFKENSSTRKVY